MFLLLMWISSYDGGNQHSFDTSTMSERYLVYVHNGHETPGWQRERVESGVCACACACVCVFFFLLCPIPSYFLFLYLAYFSAFFYCFIMLRLEGVDRLGELEGTSECGEERGCRHQNKQYFSLPLLLDSRML